MLNLLLYHVTSRLWKVNTGWKNDETNSISETFTSCLQTHIHSFLLFKSIPTHIFSLLFIFMSVAEHARYRSVVCLTTGAKPSPRRVLQRERSSAFSSNFQYLLRFFKVIQQLQRSSCSSSCPFYLSLNNATTVRCDKSS